MVLAPSGGEAEAAHGRGEVTMFGLRENLPNVQAFGALVIALAVLTWLHGPAQADIAFHRIDDGRAIAYPDLERILTESGVVASFAEGDRLAVFGTELIARADSKVFLALSSEFFSAACLGGAIDSENSSAEPGQVLVLHLDRRSFQTFYFDVERFLATTYLALDPEIRSTLEGVATSHARLKFWGLLSPVGRNARAPVSPAIEEIRRSYLLAPTVVRLRREAAGDSAKLARLVAERFVGGVVEKEVEPIKSLLSPLLFQSETEAYDRETWQMLRLRFVKTLVEGSLPGDLAQSEIQATEDSNRFRIIARERTYRLSLTAIDGMHFVAALEPEDDISN